MFCKMTSRVANMSLAARFILFCGFAIVICTGTNSIHSRANKDGNLPIYVSPAADVKNETFAASESARDKILRENVQFGAHHDAPLTLDEQIYSADLGFSSLEVDEEAKQTGGEESLLNKFMRIMSVDVDSGGQLAVVKPHEQLGSIVEMESEYRSDFNEFVAGYVPAEDGATLVARLTERCEPWVWEKLKSSFWGGTKWPGPLEFSRAKEIMSNAGKMDEIPNIVAVYETFRRIEVRKEGKKGHGWFGKNVGWSPYERVRKVVHILMKWLQYKLISIFVTEPGAHGETSFVAFGGIEPEPINVKIGKLLCAGGADDDWAELVTEVGGRQIKIRVGEYWHYFYGGVFHGIDKSTDKHYVIKFTRSNIPGWMSNRWPKQNEGEAVLYTPAAKDGMNIYIMPYVGAQNLKRDVSGVPASVDLKFTGTYTGDAAFLMFGYEKDRKTKADPGVSLSTYMERFVQNLKSIKFQDGLPMPSPRGMQGMLKNSKF